MRVAFITDEPYGTGIGKYSFHLYTELRRKGVDADFYLLKWSSHSMDVRVDGARVVRPLPFSLPLHSVEALLARLRKEGLFPRDYDIYHVAQQALVFMLPSHNKKVATIHDLKPLVIPDAYPYFTRRLLRSYTSGVKNLDAIITDSASAKSDVVALLGVPEAKIRVVPMGKSEAFQPRQADRDSLGLPANARILMNVGAEDNSKNIPFLLHVLKSICSRLDNVLFVRIGQKSPYCQRLIKELGLNRNVMYIEGLTDEVLLSRYYSSVDMLIQPSRYEGFGLPPLEAMASGCPVVCSNNSSVPEVVGDAGVMLPLDPQRWTEEILSLLADEDTLDKYRRLGVERAKGFNWSKCAEQTVGTYRDLGLG